MIDTGMLKHGYYNETRQNVVHTKKLTSRKSKKNIKNGISIKQNDVHETKRGPSLLDATLIMTDFLQLLCDLDPYFFVCVWFFTLYSLLPFIIPDEPLLAKL